MLKSRKFLLHLQCYRRAALPQTLVSSFETHLVFFWPSTNLQIFHRSGGTLSRPPWFLPSSLSVGYLLKAYGLPRWVGQSPLALSAAALFHEAMLTLGPPLCCSRVSRLHSKGSEQTSPCLLTLVNRMVGEQKRLLLYKFVVGVLDMQLTCYVPCDRTPPVSVFSCCHLSSDNTVSLVGLQQYIFISFCNLNTVAGLKSKKSVCDSCMIGIFYNSIPS